MSDRKLIGSIVIGCIVVIMILCAYISNQFQKREEKAIKCIEYAISQSDSEQVTDKLYQAVDYLEGNYEN